MVSTSWHRTILVEYTCGILHDLKTDLQLSSMSLENRQGAYGSLSVKVLSYLFLQQVSRLSRKTFHQIKLELSGQRHILSDLSKHFHEQNPKNTDKH